MYGDGSVFVGFFVGIFELSGFVVVGEFVEAEGFGLAVVEVEDGDGDVGGGSGEGDLGDEVDDGLGYFGEVDAGADGAGGGLEALEVGGFSF